MTPVDICIECKGLRGKDARGVKAEWRCNCRRPWSPWPFALALLVGILAMLIAMVCR